MTAVRLKYVADVAYGLGQPPAQANDGVPVIRATNIHRGRIVPDGLMRADPADVPWDRCPPLTAGEILVVRSGAYTGDSAMVTAGWEGSAPGYDLRITPKRVDPRFLAYVLLSTPALDYFDDCRMRAAQPHLNADQLAALRVPMMTRQTEARIADFLDKEAAQIDALIARRDSQRVRSSERRRAVIFAAAAGRLGSAEPQRPSAVPWVERLPASWDEVKLTLVARLGTGHTPSRGRPDLWVDCNIPWITTGEVAQVRDDRQEVLTRTRERISELGLANSAAELRPPGTVVLSRTASAGYSAIMGTAMATSQDFVTWTCGPRLVPRFLLFCLRAMRSDLLGRLAMGSTHKTIYFPDIESIRTPLPTIREQQRMLDLADKELRPLAPLEDAVDRQIALLRERRQALITAAVTGELQVPAAVMTNGVA